MKPARLAPESAFDQISGDEFNRHSWIRAQHLASPSSSSSSFGCAVQPVGSEYPSQGLNPGPRH